MIAKAVLLLFPLLMAFAASSDLLTMRISNRVVVLLIAIFCAAAVIVDMPLQEFGMHVLAAVVVLLFAFSMFAMGWIGGGDAKIASAAALWLGLPDLLNYLLYASLFGGALTLLLLQFRQWPLPAALGNTPWLVRLHGKEEDIPYGIALALGALLIYPESGWIRAVDLARFAVS